MSRGAMSGCRWSAASGTHDMRVPVIAALLLLAASAPVPAAQNVRGSLIDAGGNGAQYRLYSLIGPQNRSPSGSCPAGRSTGGPPTGETTCATTFNRGFANGWQSGDVIVARAQARFQVGFPPNVKPADAVSGIVTFEGWCSRERTI